MIDKYELFRKLMDLVADDFEVIDADMSNWEDAIEIRGVSDGKEIILTAKLKEADTDGN